MGCETGVTEMVDSPSRGGDTASRLARGAAVAAAESQPSMAGHAWREAIEVGVRIGLDMDEARLPQTVMWTWTSVGRIASLPPEVVR